MINIYDLLPYFERTRAQPVEIVAYDVKTGYVAFVDGEEIFGVDVDPDTGGIVAVHEVRRGQHQLESNAKLEIYAYKPQLVRTCINVRNQQYVQ